MSWLLIIAIVFLIMVLGTHERCCKKCRRRSGPQGQDVLDRRPVSPQPPSDEPIVVKDVND